MSDDGGAAVGGLMLLAFLLGLYFLPALIALSRNHRQVGPIIVLDLLLGWTLIGWVGALIWSMTTPAPPVVINAAAAAAPALPAVGLRPCPHCAEAIQPAAKVCRFCNRDVAPAV